MISRHRVLTVFALSVTATVLWHFLSGGADGGMEQRHLGTWTDPKGPPGNRITFSLVWRELPNSLFQAGEGVVTAKHWFGQAEVTASWGYEHFDAPLRLNVTTKERNYVVPVQYLGDDVMRAAFHE